MSSGSHRVERHSAVLLAGQQEVNGPTATNVRPRPAQVVEDILARTIRLFQGACENGELAEVQVAGRQGSVIVCSTCEGNGAWR